jgi:hypothetical protein
MFEQDEHDDLRSLNHQSVIPYVYEDDCCIAVYDVVQVLS